MQNAYVTGVIGAAVVSYLLMGVFLTIDLAYCDKYSKNKKYIMFSIIWLIPVIGMAWIYNQLKKRE